MSHEVPVLEAQPRERLGTRYAKRLRTTGQLPAVIYGHGSQPTHVSVDEKSILAALRRGIHVFNVKLGDTSETCLVKDLQFGWLGDNVVHIDLARVNSALEHHHRTFPGARLLGGEDAIGRGDQHQHRAAERSDSEALTLHLARVALLKRRTEPLHLVVAARLDPARLLSNRRQKRGCTQKRQHKYEHSVSSYPRVEGHLHHHEHRPESVAANIRTFEYPNGMPVESNQITLARKAVAEFLGTAMLLATVVGSGIMGERLAAGNIAIALLANTLATGAGLVALILTFGSVSLAHFNPAVTLAAAAQGGLRWSEAAVYVCVQVLGALVGVSTAHLMFGEELFTASTHVRQGGPQLFSEFIATFGLLAVISGCSRRRAEMVPYAVGAYITAAYWFTASTSFANPAVTLARALTNTFSGIRPTDVPGFVLAQSSGALVATLLFRWLVPPLATKEVA